MNISEEKYAKAAQYISSTFNSNFKVAIVLGTGLSTLLEDSVIKERVFYKNIPGFPLSTVEGHAGELIHLEIAGKQVLVLSGRFHYYEGHSMGEVTFPIKVLHFLGVQHILLSNVAGGLNPKYEKGDVVFIRDHINLLPENPLRGENDNNIGPRFPDMLGCYSDRLKEHAVKYCDETDLSFHTGVYLALQGPNLETPAEYNMFHKLGADLVGMSTVPEVLVAHHAGMNIFAASIVSNVCYPIDKLTKTTIDSVIKVAEIGGRKLSKIFAAIIKNLEV